MRRSFLIILMMGLVGLTKAQYQGANWPLQYNDLMLKITADTFERDSVPYCYYYFFCGGPNGFMANASISDNAGNLLLFSYGEDVRNKYGNIVEGGWRLTYNVGYPDDTSSVDEGDPHFQGALFLPRPGAANQYYLIIKDEDSTLNGQPSRVTATLVDAVANNDSGKVLRADQVLLQNTLLSDARMTACKHANGRDWWLINHQLITNDIYTNLITPDSIYGPYEQSIGAPGSEPDNAGWSLFSPDGNNFVTTTAGAGAITLLDFDRCTGTFSNFRSISTNASLDTEYYSNLAFSPSGRFLYASNARWLEQYDLHAQDIAASRVQLVRDTANFPLLGQMVLMPNSKIYQAGWTVVDSMLSVIDSPDVKGIACGFHLRSVLIPNSIEITNVPNFPNYNLGALPGSPCDTLTGLTEIQRATKEQILKIYPNPATDITTIDYGFTDWNLGLVSVEITNALGQLIYTQPLPMYSGLQKINTSPFTPGIYTIAIKRKGATVAVAKLVKE